MTGRFDFFPGHRAMTLSLAAVVGIALDVFLWQLRLALDNWQIDRGVDRPHRGSSSRVSSSDRSSRSRSASRRACRYGTLPNGRDADAGATRWVLAYGPGQS